jgi:hypothetical protein
VLIVGPRLYQALALDCGRGVHMSDFSWQPPVLKSRMDSGPALQCSIPMKLGIPLVLTQLAPVAGNSGRSGDESTAIRLLATAKTGFAPAYFQATCLGPVLVCRSDGQDFTVEQMSKLSSYMGHLMTKWTSDEWLCDDSRRAAALNPQAYLQYAHTPVLHPSMF